MNDQGKGEPIMKRRQVIKGGIGLVALGAAGNVFGARPCPPTLSGSSAVACPAPVGSAEWLWDAPSLQDERDFYDNILNWSRTSSDENFDSRWPRPPSGGYSDLHNDSEGDDLWTWYQQNKRYQTGFTQGWRDAWLNWYKSSYLNALNNSDGDGAPSGYGYDHMYGQGLAVVYNDTRDSSILPVFEGLKSIIQGRSLYRDVAAGRSVPMAFWESRGPGRWAIVAAYVAEATGDPDWIAIRDNLLDGWMNSTDWEEGGVIAAGGNYFASRDQASFVGGSGGTGAYDAGRRFHSAFEMALHVEALWRGYLATGRQDLGERLIKIAQYARYYAHRPTWNHPNVGGRFGHEGDGSRWYISDGDGSQNNAAKDCSYDLSLVNCQVIGYKLTGDSSYLNFARILFQRGIAFDQGGSFERYVPEGEVFTFIDTLGIGGGNYFAFNKGALQYTYLLLENGGNPNVLV
jgi:hypothetical protein